MMIKPIVLTGMLMLMASNALAYTQCTFTWNANSEPDLAGYRVYNATNNIQMLEVGAQTVAQLPAAQCAIGDSFYLVAFDTSGNISGPSNTATVLDTEAPLAPAGFAVTIQ